MKLTKAQQKEFEVLSIPLMKFMSENCHPHTTVLLDSKRAVLLEEQNATVLKKPKEVEVNV